MRAIVVGAMVLGFAVSPALARTAGAGDKAATTAAATSGASAANTPGRAGGGVEERLSREARGIEHGKRAPGTPGSDRGAIQADSSAERGFEGTAAADADAGESAEDFEFGPGERKHIGGAGRNAVLGVVARSGLQMRLLQRSRWLSNSSRGRAKESGRTDEPPVAAFQGNHAHARRLTWRQKQCGEPSSRVRTSTRLQQRRRCRAMAPAAHITEFNASGRQSRIAMLAQGRLRGRDRSAATTKWTFSPPVLHRTPTRATAIRCVSGNSGPRRRSIAAGRYGRPKWSLVTETKPRHG